jgi:DNA-binding MarR family transcriptional regulator
MTPATSGEAPPLARLFAIGYRLLIDGLHDRLRARGWTDVRPAFGFVLLAARDQPTSVSELAALTGATKQAASKLVETMVAAGYVQRGVDAQDRRQRPVHLTSRGRELLRSVEQIYAELEQEWANVIGRTSAAHAPRPRARSFRRPQRRAPTSAPHLVTSRPAAGDHATKVRRGASAVA